MYHVPVLLKESVEGLQIKPEGIYADITYGGGSHSAEILKSLSKNGLLIAIDCDPDAHKNKIADNRLNLIHGNYRYLVNYLEYLGIDKIDGIMADFGVSSHQFDLESRGFSYRLGGSLDMRMNQNQSLTAADILNNYEEENLFFIFKKYCDIKNPGKLISLITNFRKNNQFHYITDFITAITPALPTHNDYKYLAQVFQALRIAVNDEYHSLIEFLNSCPIILKPGGRISFISYHSLEDRAVKNLIKTGNTEGKIEKDLYGRSFLPFKQINKHIIIPEDEEINSNPRAKSAKLRIAEKL
ncbi:MAG TPA: 16S rRNA (cytosine(1402)-N(4))-methyltransferase RsmH [Bacteroidales bacterium]|nr:16S rRNA (cytosine(1402)-N(4))-methyltransferase RsmH [Bacteroidales bacterium]